MEEPAETAHTLAPENLPPDLAAHVRPAFNPKLFDRARKVAIIADLIKSGISTAQMAEKVSAESGCGVSPAQIRGWSQAYNIEATETIKGARKHKEPKHMEKPVETPKPKKKAQKEARRQFSEKEKILYAVRYRKLGIDNWEEGARQLEISPSALRSWVVAFDKLRPQQKAAIKIAEHGKISEEDKAAAVAAINRGENWNKVAKDYNVHRDSIKNWYLKTDKRWPSPWATRSKKPGVKAKQQPLDPRAADAVADIEGGKLISEVAKELGVMSGTVRTWWRAINGNKKWPNQYIQNSANSKMRKGVKYGPQKKTRDRLSIREAVLSNSQVITASQARDTQSLNGAAQPISTGKAVHDALVFLQIARDEYTKAIIKGTMRADDPAMLFPMLALHTLSK